MSEYHREYMRNWRNGKYIKKESGVSPKTKRLVYDAIVEFALDNHRMPSKREIDTLVPTLSRQYLYNVLHALRGDKLVDWESGDLGTMIIKDVTYTDTREKHPMD